MFRTDPAQQQFRRAGQDLAEGAVVQGIELGPVTTVGCGCCTMPTWRAIASAVSGWSPVTMTMRIPARRQARTESNDLWPRRVAHGDQPQEGQARLRFVLRDVGAVDLPPAGRQHAKSLRCHLIARSRHP